VKDAEVEKEDSESEEEEEQCLYFKTTSITLHEFVWTF